MRGHSRTAGSRVMRRLDGITKLLLPRADQPDASILGARALFGVPSALAARRTRSDLVSFLRQVFLFDDLGNAELNRLARIVHERDYRDAEYISEEGKPGAALFVLRTGVVEITRRTPSGDEVPIATLEPPASFD